MGYDMSGRSPRTEEPTGWTPGEDPWYYSLNIWGMGEMRDIMWRAGCFTEEDYGFPEFPHYPGNEHFDDEGEPTDAEGEAYEEGAVAVRMREYEDGVPAYKFCSNDGWIVTPKECQFIADKLREYVASGGVQDTEWQKEVLAFADFCERCAVDADGFEVR